MQDHARLRCAARAFSPSVAVMLIFMTAFAAQAGTIVEVRCKAHHCQVDTPIMVDLASAGKGLSGPVWLIEEGTARRVAAQTISGPARLLCFVMPPRAIEGGVRRFRADAEKPGEAGFCFDESDKDRIVITELGKGVLSYVRGEVLKPGVPDRYRRSCYVHPLYDLDGAVLTDDFPRDHFHHRGMSWAWPRVFLAGRLYDMWGFSELRDHCVKTLSSEAGPACAVLRVADQWRLKDAPVLDEKVELCVWRSGEVGRAIDVFLTLTARSESIRIGGQLESSKGYGGFNVRFALRCDTVLFGPNGRQGGDSNRVPMAWSDLSGKFVPESDRTSGLSIFDAPSNPGFPSGWSNRVYGYLNPAWPGLGLYELKPEHPLRLRYRVWIHRGDAVAGRAVQAQQAFVDPPEASIVSGG